MWPAWRWAYKGQIARQPNWLALAFMSLRHSVRSTPEFSRTNFKAIRSAVESTNEWADFKGKYVMS
jgi:hypothetical protein